MAVFGELVSSLVSSGKLRWNHSFVAQMGVAGFGHALVPIGGARALGIDDKLLISLGRHGLMRPVRFVARKSTYSLPVVSNFFLALKHIFKRRIARLSPGSRSSDQSVAKIA